MTITELKNNIQITDVAEHLGIVIGKSDKACCPFHNDKTPSFQFSKEKQIVTCFSSNCDFGTKDAIGLTEKKLNLTTHEAINYLKENCINSSLLITSEPTPTKEGINYKTIFEQLESTILNSKVPKEYLEQRGLDYKQLQIGYNPFKGQKWEKLRGCVVFPLRDKENNVVSLYGRSVRNNDKAKHYYLADRKGLYPKFPPAETKKLILTESIIDAETLIQQKGITKDFQILALYGTNGLTQEHSEAIANLTELEEVILFFDGDEAGIKASEKYARELANKNLTISTVSTPENEDINSLFVNYGVDCLLDLLANRKSNLKEEKTILQLTKAVTNQINTSNTNNIIFSTETAVYYIKGGTRKDLDSLKVTLVIEHLEYKTKSRNKLDLYEDKQTERVAREAGEKLNLRADLVERDLSILTDLLDDYRESVIPNREKEAIKVILTPNEKAECLAFLQKKNLLKEINNLIGKSGVVGELNNRIFLFVIASSYKMSDTLHALIQGSSGSGKTHLLNTIMEFMPPEDTISLTRVTESSFYNYGQFELQNKLIGMEDFDGLEEKAELAFRELQSKGMISSSTSGKNEQTGKIEGFIKEVYGPIASLSATTKGAIYEDNMNRSFLVAVDETKAQTLKIIKYQNQRAAGLINENLEDNTREFLRNCIRLLSPQKVVNPFADKIELPKDAHKIRRLNDLFQSFIKQVTLLNQYQRNKNKQGKLIAEKEDIKIAIEIMFDSIVLKVDELDGSLRDFYEKLKNYVSSKSKEYEFTRREIRHEIKISNTQIHRYLKQLIDLEYIYQSSGYDNKGHKYKISYWDDLQALRNRIKTDLNNQLAEL